MKQKRGENNGEGNSMIVGADKEDDLIFDRAMRARHMRRYPFSYSCFSCFPRQIPRALLPEVRHTHSHKAQTRMEKIIKEERKSG